MTEPSFQTLGRYMIRAGIGRGGFATVYQALDTSLNREVALKILHPQMSADRTFVERFRKEARTLASLRHLHIVTVYEVSEVEGRLYIAMELAHGPSLAQAIADRKRFSWADTLAILKPVSEALDYAHGQGVVHRDLKPANVLLDVERGPLLTDFGFARLLGDSSASMSLSGGILGTPAYIAPEVWELDTATPAADVYALGCIAYEMLTGDVLFLGKTPMQSMRAHDRGPQFPATWPADVPSGFAAVLQVALARKPEDRYPKPTTFWHALNDLEANAQAAREQAERQAVADRWKAEVAAALAAGEWSAAKMAVGRWLSITPDDPQAQAARQELERQIAQQAKQKEEAERAAQITLAAEAARKAKEEADHKAQEEAARKAKAEVDRKAHEEQERQRQAELATRTAAEKVKQEAAERERQRQAREAARQAEEEARRQELASQQPVVAKSVQNAQTATAPKRAESNKTWLYVAGGVIAVIVIGIIFASARPFGGAVRPKLKVGLVTDVGGVNDKSFNQSAWEGVQKAATEFGFDAKFIESKQPTDYEKSIDQFATENYDVIITVGFLMGDATAAKAKQYPNIKFAIIDNAYYPTQGSAICSDAVKDCYTDGGLTNMTSLMFQEDEPGFLAGVVAGGITKSGTVCTVSGMEIPPVVRYVTGFQNGAKWINPNVKTLNVYIPSFIDPAKGKEMGNSMIGQGCDVIFGVGGNTGNGGLLAAKENVLPAIGVDVDQYNTYPEVKDALVTSAMKNVDMAVYAFLKAVSDNLVKAGVSTANMKNRGVGIAPYHDWDSKVPAAVKAKVQVAIDGLANGTLTTGYNP